ncbi:TraM recognition domain-containing protein [Streptomyces enissocaesilis]|uniref:TraD/TraG TraM recognition site domain-containing protein n=1 Tax=Streptomyces enissocaesilis TaxID=332589 RepID=A0ABN3XIZ2_9ACTN
MRPHDRHQQQQGGRGIPDSLLVALLAFLLGLSVLAWLATGLAGLFAHGAWPDDVTFARTPSALRHLMAAPHDIPAAWPDTPPDQLSGYGLFWGLLIGELMVLGVLTIFVMGVLARLKVQRETARAAARATEAEAAGRPEAAAPPPMNAGPGAGYGPGPASHPGAEPPDAGHGPGPASPTGATASPGPGAGHAFGAPPRTGDHAGVRTGAPAGAPLGTPPGAATGPGGAQDAAPSPYLPPGSTAPGPAPHPLTAPQPQPEPQPQPAGAWSSPAVPAPRAPRLLYGSPEIRRPTAVQAVLDAEGPALVVTSDPTVWAETKDARAKLGPVLVYDPGHLCDTPARLHWSPTAGCDRADTAAARAVALLAPVRPQARLDAAVADTAQTLLSSWLHAAAVDGRPFRQVHRWAQGHGAHEAVRILRTHPKASSGAAGLLESALTAYPERREIAQELTARAFAALSSVHIREACTPHRTDSLALESFAGEGGTLYVVGEAIEDPRSRPGAMPLLTALASSVVEHGRRMAARSSAGRLDPPMTFVLDDVAAVAPLPRLPELLSTGQDQGLSTLVLLRSREQGRARWPDHTLTAG